MFRISSRQRTITRAYFDDNLLKSEKNRYADNIDRTVTYTYEPDGERNTLELIPAGAYKFNYDYTARGQLESVTRVSTGIAQASYGYNLDGDMTSRTLANSTSSTLTFDPLNRVKSISDALVSGTRSLTYDYDDYNRQTNVWLPNTVDVPSQGATSYEYTATNGASAYTHTTNSVRKTKSPTNIVTGQLFDANFRVSQKIDGEGSGLGLVTRYGYDENGNQTVVTDPRGVSLGDVNYTTTTAYDSRNRKTRSKSPNPFAYITEWKYDQAGNLLTLARDVGGPDQTTAVQTYDNMNRVQTQKVLPDAKSRLTSFDYWPAGTLKSVTVADTQSQVTTFSYWPSDLKKTMTYNNNDTQAWTYDDALNLASRKNSGGKFQVFSYDERNRKAKMGWYTTATPAATATPFAWATGSYTCFYSYDGAGRLTQANNETSNVTRKYDAAGRLEFDRQQFAEFPNNPHEVQYKHDGDGKVVGLLVPPTATTGYNFKLDYDGAGRLDNYKAGAATTPSYQYVYDQASNPVERKNYANGTSLLLPRDSLNRVTRRDITGPGGYIAKESYGYDDLSRIHIVQREMAGQRDSYDYDDISQLKTANYDLSLSGGVWQNPSRTVSYGWDKAGNRDSVTENGTVKPYANNGINQYTSAEGATVANGGGHQITGYLGVAYDYIGDTFLTQVTSISPANTYTLRYDALGRCVRRELNGVASFYLFDGEHWIMEYRRNNATGALTNAPYSNALYGLGIDEIIARDVNGGRQFLMQDWLGSTSMVLGGQAQVLEKYSYDAFGAPTIKPPTGTGTLSASAIGNPFMFTGREYVSAFGIYEYRNRAYHPGLGRFTTEDPKGFDAGDYNLFRYCGNDPLDKTDPMGLAANDNTSPFLQFEHQKLQNVIGSLIPQWVTVSAYTVTFTESGNWTNKNDMSHVTDEKITAKGAPTSGKTVAQTSVSVIGKNALRADLNVNWLIRRSMFEKHPELMELEKQHPNRWSAWWLNKAQPAVIEYVKSHAFWSDLTAQIRTAAFLGGMRSAEFQQQIYDYEPPTGGGTHQSPIYRPTD